MLDLEKYFWSTALFPERQNVVKNFLETILKNFIFSAKSVWKSVPKSVWKSVGILENQYKKIVKEIYTKKFFLDHNFFSDDHISTANRSTTMILAPLNNYYLSYPEWYTTPLYLNHFMSYKLWKKKLPIFCKFSILNTDCLGANTVLCCSFWQVAH